MSVFTLWLQHWSYFSLSYMSVCPFRLAVCSTGFVSALQKEESKPNKKVNCNTKVNTEMIIIHL